MGFWQGTAYSVACVVLGASALLASRSANVSLRRIAAAGLLLALLVTAVTIPLPTRLGERDWMGDYGLYTANRRQFEQYTGHDVVFLPGHLSSVLVGRFDRLLGSYPDSPPRAFLLLSWLGTVMFVAELLIVATLNGWSKQALQ